MPLREGYFIGNVSTGRMDFWWFLVGNCVAILSSLATPEQATAIRDLIGEMPLKIAYQALEGHEWTVITMLAHGQHCFGCLPRHVSRLAGWRWRREPSNKWSGGC